VIRGRKVRPVPRAKPGRPVLLVQQVRRAHKARKDPSAPRVQLANAVQPVHQVRLGPWDRKARRARLADKVPQDLLASAARRDRRDQLARPVPPALPVPRAIRGRQPRFALSLERTAWLARLVRSWLVLSAPAARPTERSARRPERPRLACACVSDLKQRCGFRSASRT
jgi:hypothetical protein